MHKGRETIMSKNETTTAPKSENKPKPGMKVEGTFADPWKPTAEGEVISGVYLGSQQALGKRGAFTAYHIKTDDGRRLSVSGAGLNQMMCQVPKKTRVTITYQGTQTTDKGEMKLFDVVVPEGTALLDPFADDGDN